MIQGIIVVHIDTLPAPHGQFTGIKSVPISPTNQAIQRLVVKIVLVNPRARYRLRAFVDATEPQYSLLIIVEYFLLTLVDLASSANLLNSHALCVLVPIHRIIP